MLSIRCQQKGPSPVCKGFACWRRLLWHRTVLSYWSTSHDSDGHNPPTPAPAATRLVGDWRSLSWSYTCALLVSCSTGQSCINHIRTNTITIDYWVKMVKNYQLPFPTHRSCLESTAGQRSCLLRPGTGNYSSSTTWMTIHQKVPRS